MMLLSRSFEPSALSAHLRGLIDGAKPSAVKGLKI